MRGQHDTDPIHRANDRPPAPHSKRTTTGLTTPPHSNQNTTTTQRATNTRHQIPQPTGHAAPTTHGNPTPRPWHSCNSPTGQVTRTHPTPTHRPTETGHQHRPTSPFSPQGPQPGVAGTSTTNQPRTGDRENPHLETQLTQEQQGAPTEPPQATGSHWYLSSPQSMRNHTHTQPPSLEGKPQNESHNAKAGLKPAPLPLRTSMSHYTTADNPEQRERSPPRHQPPTRTYD